MNRRFFLKCLGLSACAALGPALSPSRAEDAGPVPAILGPEPASFEPDFAHPAMFYRKLEGSGVQCLLCPRRCSIPPGQRGHCRVRENRDGELFTMSFGRIAAINNDPIEKKPFFHFLPGTMVLSAAAAGCNIHCKFCQNWQLSQAAPEQLDAIRLSPENLVGQAREHGIPSLAFTYSEPSVFFEFVYETARAAREAGINFTVVSNGYINPEPVGKLAPLTSAYKIDLKSFSDDFYRDYCQARLDPVLKTLETLAASDAWLEIVNLVLPTANDSEKEIRTMAAWIKKNLGDSIPIHFTRFHPMYKLLNLPPTPVSTLEACHAAAKSEGLKYVYVGNVPGHPLECTYCHNCGEMVVRRTGLWAVESHLDHGACPKCRTAIPGVWV
ncbi:MAG: AmmeMemoRadiSam system radical SAM enzyme [Pseudomonadota bacterium]